MSSQPTNAAGREAWIRYSNRPTFTVRAKTIGNDWQPWEFDVEREPLEFGFDSS